MGRRDAIGSGQGRSAGRLNPRGTPREAVPFVNPLRTRLKSTFPFVPGPRLLLRIGLGLALSTLFLSLRVAEHYPVLPNPLTFDLVLEPGDADRADPLIVTGRTQIGDFLSVAFLDAGTVRFTYDHWGEPAIASLPVTLRPGAPLRLQVTMPGLDQVRENFIPADDRLRIECDGRTLLDERVMFFIRERSRIFFGENSLGGTACGPRLLGRITNPDGRVLRGGPGAIFTLGERLRDWLKTFPLEAPLLLLFGLVLGWYGDRLPRCGSMLRQGVRLAIRHRWFTGAFLAATAVFSWLVTYGTFRITHEEMYGSFYDYQAAALLRGQLDVPEKAIRDEAFETRGRIYGYFGPTPALARLPLTLARVSFGRLSRGFMIAWFIASLLAAYQILQHARRAIAGAPAGAVRPAGPFPSLVLVGGAGLGSTLFFLGSRSFMYHEAILAGIAFALWSIACTLRHLEAPGGRWWIGALVCGMLSLHARPPTGLFALSCLGAAVVLGSWQSLRRPGASLPAVLARPAGIAFACLSALLTLNGVAWLKFRTFDAAPLRLSRPFTGTPGRLERIDGRSFHLVNLPHNFDAYFVRTNFHFEREFPWFYLGTSPVRPLRTYPHAKIDLPDHTLALPYAMPGLFLLAVFGSVGAARLHPACRPALAALWLGVVPMTVALLAAVAIAQRYTGDFCPFLIGTGAYGLAAAESVPSRWRLLTRSLIALATFAAVAITLAITLHYQRDTLWGMPDELRDNYQKLRQRIGRMTGNHPAANSR